MSGKELEAAWRGRERSECDGEVHELLRFVAHRYDPGIRVRYATRLVLGFAHVVYDELLRLVVERSRLVHGTDDVHLVVLERQIALVHVDYVVRVVDPESAKGKRGAESATKQGTKKWQMRIDNRSRLSQITQRPT